MNPLKSPVTELARALRAGEISAVDLLEAHIARIEAVNPILNGLVADRYDPARKEAVLADERLAKGEGVDSPLLGVPCTIKEFLPVTDMPNTGGILWNKSQVATEDCPIVSRLRKAGAIVMGVSNIPEGGLWMETYNPIYGRTLNPWNPKRTPGGSSGGEAALVASGGSPFGIGSDVGGSIRIPAAFCGTVGHKPTGGLVPNTGHFPAEIDLGGAGTYLVCGPITRTVDDAWTILKIIAGPDGKDDACREMTLGDPDTVDLSSVVVYPMETPGRVWVWRDVRSAIRQATAVLAAKGARVDDRGFSNLKYSMEIWSAMLAEGTSTPYTEILGQHKALNVLWEFVRWATGFGRHTIAALVMAFADRLAAFLPGMRTRFMRVGLELQEQLEEALGDDGVLIFPPYTRSAPRHWAPFLTPFDAQCTAVFNVLGFPVTQVPVGFDANGLPLGVQVVGARGRDHLTIAVAREIEKALGGWQQADPTSNC